MWEYARIRPWTSVFPFSLFLGDLLWSFKLYGNVTQIYILETDLASELQTHIYNCLFRSHLSV